MSSRSRRKVDWPVGPLALAFLIGLPGAASAQAVSPDQSMTDIVPNRRV